MESLKRTFRQKSISSIFSLVCIVIIMGLILVINFTSAQKAMALSSSKGTSIAEPGKKIKEITDALDQIIIEKSQGYFSGSVLVAQKDVIYLKKGYGSADYEANIPNTPETVFEVGSLTKQFTAMAVLMLEEKGLLKVADPISKYISDYPEGDKITIHHLLTHTSGLEEYVTDRYLDELGVKKAHYFSPEELIDRFRNKPLHFEPGKSFEYSNSNYVLLGYIIEKVSGIKYEEFVKRNILEPLHMGNSGFRDDLAALKNVAVGNTYQMLDGQLRNEKADQIDLSLAYGAGGLVSTVEDLYKWDQALYTEKLVKKETLGRMFTPFLNNYGYGWCTNDIQSKDRVVIHDGRVSGFTSFIYRDTSKKRVIIILCNNDYYNEFFAMVSLINNSGLLGE